MLNFSAINILFVNFFHCRQFPYYNFSVNSFCRKSTLLMFFNNQTSREWLELLKDRWSQFMTTSRELKSELQEDNF